MSRLFHSNIALTCLVLVFGDCTGSPSAAAEECGQGYRICNVSCNGLAQLDTKVLLCKSRCDLRLISCDKRPIGPFTKADGYFIKAIPAATADIDGQ
jgi:hypothetical protein